jgi:predicted dehydrogenase
MALRYPGIEKGLDVENSSVLLIAVVGAGLIGMRHMQLIDANPATQLAAIIDPAAAASALAQQRGVPYFSNLPDYLAQVAQGGTVRPHGIILATPNAMHVDGALACLQAGIATLVEKPVADSLADAKRLLRVAQEQSTPLLIGHHRRHSSILQQVRQTLDSGLLGQTVSLTGTALFYKPDHYFDAGPWRRMAGGGPVLINLIHEIDSLRYLLGEVVQVQAMTSNAIRQFAVEDSAAISLRFASGALASFTLSDTAAAPRSWEQTSQENPDYPSYPHQDCYFISGTRGSIAVPTMQVWHYDGAPSWWTPFVSTQLAQQQRDPMAQQLLHFCDVMRGLAAPQVSVTDAVGSLAVTLAVIEAARTGGTIEPEQFA